MNLNAVRCEALFVSALQQSERLSVPEIRDAVVRTVRELGSAECAARVAQEFGDHPDTAAARMCWARRIVAAVYVWDDAYDEERQLLSRGVFAAGSY